MLAVYFKSQVWSAKVAGRMARLFTVALATAIIAPVMGLGSAQAASARAGGSSAVAIEHRQQGGPGVRSGSVLVLDEQSAKVLYERESDVAAPIASISKLMTAIVVLDAKQNLDESIEVTDDDRDYDKNTRSRLAIGSKLSRDDLLHLALMASENRAAHALARRYPGGEVACVRAMNHKARQLGMTNTHFVEPTGLSSDNMASPEDLSKLVAAAAKYPTIREYSTDEYHQVKVGRRAMMFRNTDLLVKNDDWNIIVQKTGYIAEAGRCLVLKTIITGRPVIIVLLDSVGKYTRLADAKRIRKWLETKSTASAKLAAQPVPRLVPGASEADPAQSLVVATAY